MSPFCDDDGTEINPDLFPKPQFCLSCQKNDDPGEEVVCVLTRLDQRFDKEFICYGYEQC